MRAIWLTMMVALAAPAFAQASDQPGASGDKPRDLCPERPGLDTPPCIVDKGRLLAEFGAVDWTLDKEADSRTDIVQFGDLLLRYGVGETTELQVHWDGIGHVRVRDRMTGVVTSQTRAGDVSFGIKQSLMNPGGDGLSISLDPSITAPVGRQPVGAGDWAAGLRVAMSYKMTDKLSLSATPEIDAAVDQGGSGRHLAYGSAAGIGYAVTKAVTLSAEAAAYRDDDPSGHATTTLASLSAAWQPSDDLQLDVGGVAGLNRKSPDAELYVGVSRRF